MLDFSGYHLKPAMREPLASAGSAAFEALHIPTYPLESSAFPFTFDPNISSEEDASWYGPLGFLLLAPAGIVTALRWRPRLRQPALLVHALAAPAYAIALVLVYREGSWYGRYLLSALAISLPLVAGAYRNRRVAAAFAVVGVTTLALVHAYNTNKPIGLDRTAGLEARPRGGAVSRFAGVRPRDRRGRRRCDGRRARRDRDGRAGLGLPVLRPERLRRAVVALPRKGVLDAAERRGLRVIVFGRSVPPPQPAPGWETLRFSWQGTVLVAER